MATQFNIAWTTHPKYRGWVKAVKENRSQAFCRFCGKTISLSNMGQQALESHAQSKKHKLWFGRTTCNNTASMRDFIPGSKRPAIPAKSTVTSGAYNDVEQMDQLQTEDVGSTPKVTTSPQVESLELDSPVHMNQHSPSSSGATAAPPLSTWLQSKEVRKAEVLWALHSVKHHYSLRSSETLSQLFQAMFCDSNIAQAYSCSRTNLSYLIVFGIAPYFKELLVKNIRESDYYTVIFDEAFNKVFQSDQMDILVRWKPRREAR